MSLPEMKNALNQLIQQNEDPQFLQALIDEAEAKEEQGLSWNDLSEADQQGIEQGLAELKAGLGRTHASIREKFRKWL